MNPLRPISNPSHQDRREQHEELPRSEGDSDRQPPATPMETDVRELRVPGSCHPGDSSATAGNSHSARPPDVTRRKVRPTQSEHCVLEQLPDSFLLSVVIPFFNEERTLGEIVRRVQDTKLPLEIILVNDGSSDRSVEVAKSLSELEAVTCVSHARNQGKGAALRTGFERASGSVIVVQDADLEYNPCEFAALLQPILDGSADVAYGSRYLDAENRRSDGWHYHVNAWITRMSNLATGLSLTDVETCYKAFRSSTLRQILPQLRESGFGIELEITARLARSGARITEVPISYDARTYAEGKKINWRDGVRAMWCAFRY